MTEQHIDTSRTRRRVLTGAALILGVVIEVAGWATVPPQEDLKSATYLAALGSRPGLAQLSAVLLSFGWAMLALGLVGATTLVRGPRGAVLTMLGAVPAAFGMISVSGQVYSDFYKIALHRGLPVDDAVRVYESAEALGGTTAWTVTGFLMFPALLLMLIGYVRAGVLGWWAPALYGVAMVGFFATPPVGWIPTTVLAVMFVPLVVLGVRSFERARGSVVAAERVPASAR
ncbi:hypothetical protein ACFFX1_16075 [Dactylosporangium sucinum]|uniref:DUF4386 family protein n=1 Tax=Dactylosporangium sucinum TaxID=1424081 RepID=A0A917TKT9_9ACTN|nr:hypothetical protein [Dactylosporangium sucinum]GGM27216.1 hypothetical protein GCM10007977_030540 [Dactylosporangium sucinum]